MAPRPAPKSCISHLTSLGSGASSSCRWAALALVRTAPGLLGHRPACHPIGESSITIVWLRRRHAPSTLIWATLSMNSAAPLLLGHRPSRLPICESILAIVRIDWAWWFCRLTTDMMIAAAPCLLGSVPSLVHSHGAIVWINRSGCRGGWHGRPSGRPSRGLRGRGRGWRCGKRSGWDCRHRLWQSCGWDRRATTTHCCTTEVLLRLGPRQFCGRSEAGIAIVRQGCRRTSQQPAEQRNEQ